MGRPTMVAVRRRQVLDAALRCLGTYGFAGTTLDRIAEEARMSRGHVRHFAGNREALLVQAARAFYFGDAELTPTEPSLLPGGVASLADALDFLFGELAEQDSENPIALALMEAARAVPGIRSTLVAAYLGTQDALERLLADAGSGGTRTDRAAVAYGILALALGNVFLSDVEASPARTRMARSAADELVRSLPGRGR